MKKRGQFFLIAAIVIVGIILGLATVYNTAKSSKEDTTVYDLSDEINFEAAQVIDNGVFNGEELSGTVVPTRIEILTEFYSNENPESDLIIIYGDKIKATALFYNSLETGTVSISIAGNPSKITLTKTEREKEILEIEKNKVTIDLGEGVTYDFSLREGQVFYLVIKKENSCERYISTPASN